MQTGIILKTNYLTQKDLKMDISVKSLNLVSLHILLYYEQMTK